MRLRCANRAALVRPLEPVVLAMWQLMSKVEDSFTGVGIDAYSQTLVVYQAAKLAGRDGSLDQHLEGLGKRFARKISNPTVPPATAA